MELKNKPHIFLDLDGVLATDQQIYFSNPKKWDDIINNYGFDPKCVKVFNEICKEVDPIIILSSDWKDHHTIGELNEFFERQGLTHKITDTTVTLFGKKFTRLAELEECRAAEIIAYANLNKLTKYVAIDDLDLTYWLEGYFVRTPRAKEGIKQTGIKEKILKLLK